MCIMGAAVAGDKVIQSSSKRTPGWIGGMEEGYFIVSAQAGTLEDAQQADEIVTILMGDKVEPRREFIEQNAKFVQNLDI